ncbi:adenosylcobinamide-GDP ribazoletransferase [Rubrobacter indicoceani]|uniref:adenosylcobinamide-GDP ribazoletransferase n=1 Tax=Rubrobacter indicoceani TaxID=2051957 RepID=UPI000E5BEB78|nr:adenosylcobinamide-GDP ribazoletransferase [Rubrobacter indicoceani]
MKKPEPGAEKRGSPFGFVSDFTVAVGFLTVIPVPERAWSDPDLFGRSFAWFPVAGLLVGGIVAGASALLPALLPPGVVAALLVALWVFVTGGLHLDGLMDSCDGLFCAKSPAERLEVMRDSRVGAFGVLGAFLTLLVKFAALGALLEGDAIWTAVAVVLSAVTGRWAMVFAAAAFPYHRHGGTLGAAFTRGVGARQLAVASLLTGGFSLAGWWASSGDAALLAGPVVALVVGAVASLAIRRLGGLTGDVYGAAGEVSEVAVLLVFVGFASSFGGMP